MQRRQMHICNYVSDFTGQFMYIEASSPRKPGDKAWLSSEIMERTTGSGRCLKFWYHMQGVGMGTLNAYVVPVSGMG